MKNQIVRFLIGFFLFPVFIAGLIYTPKIVFGIALFGLLCLLGIIFVEMTEPGSDDGGW